jgi:PPM family protein phosphatase
MLGKGAVEVGFDHSVDATSLGCVTMALRHASRPQADDWVSFDIELLSHMSRVETVTAAESYRERSEDRIAVFDSEDRTVIVVADGAGGVGSGDIAADTVIREIQSEYQQVHSADHWNAMLRQMDCRIGVGESTAVVVDIRPYGIVGASVGDSQAWIIADGKITDLTQFQNRKPLLGSGFAEPVSFMHSSLDGVLIVATDGFFNYAKSDGITAMISRSDFYTIAKSCIEMVRLPSGDLWDDITLVAARIKPRLRTRIRYSI